MGRPHGPLAGMPMPRENGFSQTDALRLSIAPNMEDNMRRYRIVVSASLLLLFTLPFSQWQTARAQGLAEFEKRLTEFTLDNGLKFLVLERHEAPVVSFHTYADVGAVDEVHGITGLAHLFEHMAF